MREADYLKEKLHEQLERIRSLERDVGHIEAAFKRAGWAEFQARTDLEKAWRENDG